MVYGYAGLVDGLVTRMRAEMDGTPRVVATGGLVGLMDGLARTIDVVNPHLTLEGLRIVCARARHGAGGSAPGGLGSLTRGGGDSYTLPISSGGLGRSSHNR